MSREEERMRVLALARARRKAYSARQLRKTQTAELELCERTGLELEEVRELLRSGRKPEDLLILETQKHRR